MTLTIGPTPGNTLEQIVLGAPHPALLDLRRQFGRYVVELAFQPADVLADAAMPGWRPRGRRCHAHREPKITRITVI